MVFPVLTGLNRKQPLINEVFYGVPRTHGAEPHLIHLKLNK